MVPMFKAGKMYFPEELKSQPIMAEFVNELSLASPGGFKSKHDDAIDTISMLASLQAWKPSEVTPSLEDASLDIWDDSDVHEANGLDSYIV